MPASSGSTRATPRLLLIVAAALLVARVVLGILDATHPESRAELIEWSTPASAVAYARENGRLVLYAFTDKRDADSRRIASELFTDPQVAQQFARQFVAVRIDGPPSEDTPETAALRARFGVTRTPTLVVASPDGAKSSRLVGYRNRMMTMSELSASVLEVSGMPYRGGPRGFRVQVGNRRGGIHAGDSTIVIPDDDSAAAGR